jgi:hypothetical protein
MFLCGLFVTSGDTKHISDDVIGAEVIEMVLKTVTILEREEKPMGKHWGGGATE